MELTDLYDSGLVVSDHPQQWFAPIEQIHDILLGCVLSEAV